MARRPAEPGVDRRQQILEAALDVFAEHGFEGATTSEIATRAGVTQGLIYFYFPAKEDLFFAAFEQQLEQALTQLKMESEETSDDPPEVVLRRIIVRFVEVMSSPRSCSLMRIGMRVNMHADAPLRNDERATRHNEARQRVREQGHRIVTALSDYLAAQVARGALRQVNPEIAAQFLISGLSTTLVRYTVSDGALGRATQDELIETFVTLLLHGLIPTAPIIPSQRAG